MQRPTTEHQ
jgi:hypothetical protein